ncbi:hypothetical protein AALB_3671 [Agarivorans albus MKT 106]|uniref:Uncharacterized protein n=1 Tax=Agarivorans albus MKT 106 TaxID=1331007 RepID=R9PU57_AGAAL|nr:hypothetical protein AALB_3671 [Agarivorans albus MKT 106]
MVFRISESMEQLVLTLLSCGEPMPATERFLAGMPNLGLLQVCD